MLYYLKKKNRWTTFASFKTGVKQTLVDIKKGIWLSFLFDNATKKRRGIKEKKDSEKDDKQKQIVKTKKREREENLHTHMKAKKE